MSMSRRFNLIKKIRKKTRPFELWLYNYVLIKIPSKTYLCIRYFLKTGKFPNLRNPKTFADKILWLKLYYRDYSYTSLVDKYEVRKYVADKIGEEYLIPLLGVWDKFDDIDFLKLPNQFVLKCTHDSGSIVICKDKQNFDYEMAKKKLNRALNINYYVFTREWPYKDAIPRIIAEEYIEQSNIPGKGLYDYKFHCFGGIPKLIGVDIDRFGNHKKNLYNPDWEFVDAQILYPNDKNIFIQKPKPFDDMLKIVKQLSHGHPYSRVDLYLNNDCIYFGEITFFPGGARSVKPESFDNMMGGWLTLPEKNF